MQRKKLTTETDNCQLKYFNKNGLFVKGSNTFNTLYTAV